MKQRGAPSDWHLFITCILAVCFAMHLCRTIVVQDVLCAHEKDLLGRLAGYVPSCTGAQLLCASQSHIGLRIHEYGAYTCIGVDYVTHVP